MADVQPPVLLMALTLGVAAGSSHVITGEYIDVEPDGYWTAEVAAGGHQNWNFVLGADRNHKVELKIEFPVGASLNVSVDGTDFGTVSGDSILNLDLGAGSHMVRIDNPGDVPVEYEFYMGGTALLEVTKTVVGPGPTGPYTIEVTCTDGRTPVPASFDLNDGGSMSVAIVNAAQSTCTVTETATQSASVSYACSVTAGATCQGDQTVAWGDAGRAQVDITNTHVTSVGGVTSFERGSNSSGSIALLAGAGAAMVAIATAAWYARRRWLGSRS